MAEKPITAVNIEDRKALNVRAGETIRVWQKIKEKDKIRLQAFEGLVLARKHGSEAGATFTVRKVVDGVGVEKIFPLYSPMIDKIEVIRRSKVRRAKLYYIREKASKEIRHNMRKMLALDAGDNTDTKIAGVAMSAAAAAAHDDASAVETAETK
jgi:large subunit ribosomal protein L19